MIIVHDVERIGWLRFVFIRRNSRRPFIILFRCKVFSCIGSVLEGLLLRYSVLVSVDGDC